MYSPISKKMLSKSCMLSEREIAWSRTAYQLLQRYTHTKEYSTGQEGIEAIAVRKR